MAGEISATVSGSEEPYSYSSNVQVSRKKFNIGAGMVIGFLFALFAGIIAIVSLFISWAYNRGNGTYVSGFDLASVDPKFYLLYLIMLGGLAILISGTASLALHSSAKHRKALTISTFIASVMVLIVTGLGVTSLILWESGMDVDAGAFVSLLSGILGVLGALSMAAHSLPSRTETPAQPQIATESASAQTVYQSRTYAGHSRTDARSSRTYTPRTSLYQASMHQTSSDKLPDWVHGQSHEENSQKPTGLVDFTEESYSYLQDPDKLSGAEQKDRYWKFRKKK